MGECAAEEGTVVEFVVLAVRRRSDGPWRTVGGLMHSPVTGTVTVISRPGEDLSRSMAPVPLTDLFRRLRAADGMAGNKFTMSWSKPYRAPNAEACLAVLLDGTSPELAGATPIEIP